MASLVAKAYVLVNEPRCILNLSLENVLRPWLARMSGILQTIAEDPTAPIFDLIKEGRVTVWEGPVFGLTTSVKYTDFLHLADVDVAPKPLGACLVSVKWKESGVKYKGASGAHAFREVVRTAITAAFPAFAPRVRRRNPNSGEKPRSQVFTEQALQQGGKPWLGWGWLTL